MIYDKNNFSAGDKVQSVYIRDLDANSNYDISYTEWVHCSDKSKVKK